MDQRGLGCAGRVSAMMHEAEKVEDLGFRWWWRIETRVSVLNVVIPC